MALAATTPYASYDITDGMQTRDISPLLAEALYFDLNFLEAVDVAFGDPVFDTTHYWNEDALNTDLFGLAASAASGGTTLTASSGQGSRVHIGDLLYPTASGSTEVLQVTNVSTDTITVTRGYNSTTAAALAAADQLAIIRAEQEASDIGADRSVNPTVRTNTSQIFDTFDLQVSGSQLARRMATTELQDWVAHQLANRGIEMKINLIRAALYGEKSASAGSDTVYRTMGGLRNFIRDYSGVNSSSSESFSITVLDRDNKTVVDRGVYPDFLTIGTGLVGGIAGIEASNRRLLESDTKVGYVVQEVLLKQGNTVRVVVDSRVKAGDGFMGPRDRFRLRPLNGRGMFVIAATDFTDAKKRRILGEWTAEVRNPESWIYFNNKT